MDIKKYLEKLRALPDHQKKIILWSTVIVLGLIMGYFWTKSAANNLSKIGQQFGNIELPGGKMPEIKIPDLKSITEDQTADWKTYKNDALGFEIEYPERLNPRIGAEYDKSLISESQTIINFLPDSDTIQIIVDTGSNIDKVLQAETKIFTDFTIEVEPFTIDGITGKYINVKNHPSTPFYIYIVQKGNVVYRIIVAEKDFGDNVENFISTFKFTK